MECKHFLLAGGDFVSSRARRGIYRIAHGSLAALGMTRGVGCEIPGGDRGCGQSGRTAEKALCNGHRTPGNHRGSRWQLAVTGPRASSPLMIMSAQDARGPEDEERLWRAALPAGSGAEDHRQGADAAQEVGVV